MKTIYQLKIYESLTQEEVGIQCRHQTAANYKIFNQSTFSERRGGQCSFLSEG